MIQISWTTNATENYTDLVGFILNIWGQRTATQFTYQVESMLETISGMPEAFPMVDKINGTRKWVVHKRTIMYYHYTNNIITILHLYDTRMNPDDFEL